MEGEKQDKVYTKKSKGKKKNNSKKTKSVIASFLIILITLIFLTLTVISVITPNISNEIKKDLSKGLDSLCKGDVKAYYNIYNTRKLTEIEKTKFYDKIKGTQEILNSEKELFDKYNLKIQIKDVSVIDKIGDNLFLCNLNVNYKSRVNEKTTKTINKTEDYIVKIIDVGNMDYKILLPFNSLDKDFSSSNIYRALKESANRKQTEKIKEQRELEEKNKAKEELEENVDDTIESEPAIIIDGSSDVVNSDTDKNVEENESSENIDDIKDKVDSSNIDENNNSDEDKNTSSNEDESDKSAYEQFAGN